jgi:hypothetical protein
MPSTHLADHLAAIGRLYTEPAARVLVLRTAEADPDWDPAELLEAEREVRADHEALVALLSEQWGKPRFFDLGAHLEDAAGSTAWPQAGGGAQPPEPERTLCWQIAGLTAWTVDDRWLGVGLTRRGEGIPLQLLAAVGEKGRREPSAVG